MPATVRARRGAVDPRLLRYARATRPFLVALIVLGAVTALLIIAQAWLLADVVAGAFGGRRGIDALRLPLEALLGVVLARAAVAWGRDVLADRSSARAKGQLRAALLAHVAALGPRPGQQRTGELAVLATRGIDALDGYFSLYLPQLFLAVIVPVAVLAVLAAQDWISALIIAVTLPLIPLFMALVGAATRDRMQLQFRTLQQLAGHFLDVVEGLPTLKVFGRAKAQILAIGDRDRPLPPERDVDVEGDVPLLADPRAGGHDLGRARRRRRRAAPRGRPPRAPDRADGARAGS